MTMCYAYFFVCAFEALTILSVADIYIIDIARLFKTAKTPPEHSIPEENPAASAVTIASSASQSTSCCVLGKAGCLAALEYLKSKSITVRF